jgi:hypothetical protein
LLLVVLYHVFYVNFYEIIANSCNWIHRKLCLFELAGETFLGLLCFEELSSNCYLSFRNIIKCPLAVFLDALQATRRVRRYIGCLSTRQCEPNGWEWSVSQDKRNRLCAAVTSRMDNFILLFVVWHFSFTSQRDKLNGSCRKPSCIILCYCKFSFLCNQHNNRDLNCMILTIQINPPSISQLCLYCCCCTMPYLSTSLHL